MILDRSLRLVFSLVAHAGDPSDPMQTSYTNKTDEESLLTDAESYVRTDDEESYQFKTDEEDAAELYDRDPKVREDEKESQMSKFLPVFKTMF